MELGQGTLLEGAKPNIDALHLIGGINSAKRSYLKSETSEHSQSFVYIKYNHYSLMSINSASSAPPKSWRTTCQQGGSIMSIKYCFIK